MLQDLWDAIVSSLSINTVLTAIYVISTVFLLNEYMISRGERNRADVEIYIQLDYDEIIFVMKNNGSQPALNLKIDFESGGDYKFRTHPSISNSSFFRLDTLPQNFNLKSLLGSTRELDWEKPDNIPIFEFEFTYKYEKLRIFSWLKIIPIERLKYQKIQKSGYFDFKKLSDVHWIYKKDTHDLVKAIEVMNREIKKHIGKSGKIMDTQLEEIRKVRKRETERTDDDYS